MALSSEEQESRLMTVSECSDWLHISKVTLYTLMREGLPYYRLGDRRFNREAVLDWLQSRKVETS